VLEAGIPDFFLLHQCPQQSADEDGGISMQNPVLEKLAFSVNEVCYVGNFGHSTFYEVVAAGRLVVRKLGRRTIVLREDLDRFLAALPVANAEIKPALADRSENLNRTASPLSESDQAGSRPGRCGVDPFGSGDVGARTVTSP
jgi:hypothetical protein